jgi:hypothetical protein
VAGIITAVCCAVFLRDIKFNPTLSRFWYPVLFFFGFIFLSSWYITATTNGLRQGLALPFLYLSFSYLFSRKKIIAIFWFLISVSLHYSSFLVLPFTILAFFNFKFVVLIFCTLAFSYFLGFNELVVKEISDYSGFRVYENIKNYAGNSDYQSGFQFDLFLYTIFWPIIIGLGLFFKFFDDDGFKVVQRANHKYMILALPYFVFGFGAFSNRYAFICWFFIPFLQAIALSNIKIPIFYRSITALFLCIFGVNLFSKHIIMGYG